MILFQIFPLGSFYEWPYKIGDAFQGSFYRGGSTISIITKFVIFYFFPKKIPVEKNEILKEGKILLECHINSGRAEVKMINVVEAKEDQPSRLSSFLR